MMKTTIRSRDFSFPGAARRIEYRLVQTEEGYGIELEETAPGMRECECRPALDSSRQRVTALLITLYEYGVTLAAWQDVLQDLLILRQEG